MAKGARVELVTPNGWKLTLPGWGIKDSTLLNTHRATISPSVDIRADCSYSDTMGPRILKNFLL